MRQKFAILIPLFFLLSVTACVPMRVDYPDWPDTTGKIVDATSGSPIAGATVTVRSSPLMITASAITGPDGGFYFPRHTHKAWIPSPPYDLYYAPSTLSVTATSHRPFQELIPSFAWEDGKRDGALAVPIITLMAAPSQKQL